MPGSAAGACWCRGAVACGPAGDAAPRGHLKREQFVTAESIPGFLTPSGSVETPRGYLL